MPFAVQPLLKICRTLTAAYVRGPGIVLVADLFSEIQTISEYRCDGLPLSRERQLIANVTKLSALLIQIQRNGNAGLTLVGSLCGNYDARLNVCGVHDGLMRRDATF